MPSLQELAQAFWAQVQQCCHGVDCTLCCWDWLGCRNDKGYGRFSLDGKQVLASRVAVVFAHGAELLPLRIGRRAAFYALHRCDRPPCVNWHHLFVGTSGDNTRDERMKYLAFMERRAQMTRADIDRIVRFSAPA